MALRFNSWRFIFLFKPYLVITYPASFDEDKIEDVHPAYLQINKADIQMSKNALIVDDSRLACRMLAKMLDTFGIANAEVYSAKDALEYLQRKQPDVIFLDHTMQGMNGLEMMKVVKSNPLTASIPVMMFTAKEGDFYIKQARAAGAVEVLPKGLDSLYLFKVLNKFGLIDEKAKNELSTLQAGKKKEAVPTKRVSVPGNQPAWKLFWQQRAEPYLDRQRGQQQKELQYRIDTQTRKLTREIHLTLEQFEHALVLRMESHADFVASVENEAKSIRRKWFMSMGVLVVLLQLAIFVHLWKVNGLNNELQLVQEESLQKQTDANQQLLQIKEAVNELTLNVQALKDDKEPDMAHASLIDENELFVSELVLMDKNKLIYRGITPNGYNFEINSRDEVGQTIKERYYLTDNCQGDIFVKSAAATILKGANGDIWYVDKQSELTAMNIASKQAVDSECIVLSGDVMSLRYLQRNVSTETGIDPRQTMKIYFAR